MYIDIIGSYLIDQLIHVLIQLMPPYQSKISYQPIEHTFKTLYTVQTGIEYMYAVIVTV